MVYKVIPFGGGTSSLIKLNFSSNFDISILLNEKALIKCIKWKKLNITLSDFKVVPVWTQRDTKFGAYLLVLVLASVWRTSTNANVVMVTTRGLALHMYFLCVYFYMKIASIIAIISQIYSPLKIVIFSIYCQRHICVLEQQEYNTRSFHQTCYLIFRPSLRLVRCSFQQNR